MTNLLQHIEKFVPLSANDRSIITDLFQTRSFRKKEFLLKEGQVCRSNYFVTSGCLRLYFLNDKGQEQTTQFAIENWWITDQMSYDKQIPSEFHLQTVEKSIVQIIDRQQQEKLFIAVPAMERYFRNIAQRAYAATQQRIRFLYSLTKEEQYLHFTGLYPEFIERIPQYMLASYLDFTPEYLSELRKKKRRSIS